MKKRILSFLVALVMLLASLPLSSIDVSAATTYTGTFGGVNFSMDKASGTLTFTKGAADADYEAGEMETFSYTPYNYRFSTSFSDDTVKKVVIKDGVTNIGDYVFYNMTNLVEIEIAGSVKTIGARAFQNCASLGNITFPEGLETISYYAFQECTSFTEVSLPGSLKTICWNAFQGCTNLKTVTLKEGLEEIGAQAFYNCTDLTDITYPASVKNVGKETLTNTAYLTNLINQCNEVDDVDLAICGHTLVYCYTHSRKSSFEMPDGIYCIAADALNKSGTSVVSISEFHTNEVKYISDGVGDKNTSFSKIYFENVEEIGDAFGQCSISYVYFYEGLKSLGSAFVNGSYGSFGTVSCYDSDRVFPSTLEYLDSGAFSQSYSSMIYSLRLTADEAGTPLYIDDILMAVSSTNYYFEDTFVIKDGTRVIADGAFKWATPDMISSSNGSYENVTTMEIPSSIVTMDNVKVFPNLTDIYYAGSRNDWKAINHLGAYDGITIHYGSECTEHHYEAVVTKPTCTTDGYTTYTCTECGDTYSGDTVKASHSYGAYKATKKATTSNNGTQTATCTACGVEVTKTIKKISDISLSATSYTYNGKARTPGVTVTDSKGNKLTKGTDYTVAYAKGRKNVGKYSVKITFKGNYSGSKTLYFTIKPKATTISSLTKGSKQLTVKWKKQSTQVTGYQIRYSTSSSMKSAKTTTVSSYKTTQKTVKSLKAKKTYYVQIRTYKTVSGKKYYSSWSAKRSVKTK